MAPPTEVDDGDTADTSAPAGAFIPEQGGHVDPIGKMAAGTWSGDLHVAQAIGQPAATDRGTVRLVLWFLAVIDLLLWAITAALSWRVIGMTDADQILRATAVVAPFGLAASGTLGVIGGSMINTRSTPS